MATPNRGSESNPKNNSSQLFRKLTRFFSGNIVNYKRQFYRKEKRRDLNKYKFTSASGKAFKRSAHNPFQTLQANIMSNQNRVERYGDFEEMEYEPIIASSLDLYADEMTTSNALEPLLRIECPNDEIKVILNDLFYNILNIEHNLYGWSRTMCKFGDFFLYLDIDPEFGIQNVIGLPSTEVERLEGQDKTNPNYIQFQWNSGGMTFENWQMAHFRILGNDKYAPYGTSVLEPARRVWRQMNLLEDAMMAYRIVRSPERRVYYIQVGDIEPEDVEQYMEQVITQMKRNQVVDPDSGRVDLRFNPMSVEEDIYIPVRGDIHSKVDSLPGGQYTGDIEDVKYLKDKLFAALKVPQSYLFRGDGANEDKTTLSQKDIAFARTIQRLQLHVVAELEKIALVHLYTLGFRGDDLKSFGIALNNPSKLAEMQQLENWRLKFEIASNATEGFASRRWISENIFNWSYKEFKRNQLEMYYDRKFDARLEAMSQMAQEGGGGTFGGDLGELPDEPAMDDLEGEDLDVGAEEESGEDDILLATPGKRDDEIRKLELDNGLTTTDKSKGKWYAPKKRDDRKLGAFRRKMKGAYNSHAGSSSKTNIHPGSEYITNMNNVYESSHEEKVLHNREERLLTEAKEAIESIDDLLNNRDRYWKAGSRGIKE